MSFAEIARHLIDADEWLFRKLRTPSLVAMQGGSGLEPVASREEFEALIQRLSEVGAQRAAVIAGLTEDELERELPDDRFGGAVSVWWVVVRGNLDHEAQHRGQIATYLRLVRSLSPA